MTINADGSHAVQPHTANAHTAPARPVRHAVVEEEVLEPLRPVDGWGFTNRVILVSVLVVIIGDVVRVLTGGLGDPNGSVALGETGRGWVVLLQSLMFGLVGGALAGAAGYLIVLLMGGAARSVVRYVVGGVVGGFLGAVGLFAVFSNTVLYGSGVHLFWMLPVAGLLGGLWAGVVSSRR